MLVVLAPVPDDVDNLTQDVSVNTDVVLPNNASIVLDPDQLLEADISVPVPEND